MLIKYVRGLNRQKSTKSCYASATVRLGLTFASASATILCLICPSCARPLKPLTQLYHKLIKINLMEDDYEKFSSWKELLYA